ncbi:hypothetical protein ACHAXA_007652 [Cyclostephanos tholiformis]|uniref:Uncharacterized protein n=1 Tax=Cyclostephanos tholiformis TaxID=382380 RepID=A0ABD3SDP4_9STRA
MADDASSTDPIAELQSRIEDLELSKAHNEISAAVRNERVEFLIGLRKIMEAMKTEAGCEGASSKEINRLKAENNELKKINAKQRYRIDHLVHNLRDIIEGKGGEK